MYTKNSIEIIQQQQKTHLNEHKNNNNNMPKQNDLFISLNNFCFQRNSLCADEPFDVIHTQFSF